MKDFQGEPEPREDDSPEDDPGDGTIPGLDIPPSPPPWLPYRF